MKKRILSILLLCCMVLTLLPVTVSAAATGAMDNIPSRFDKEIDLVNEKGDINIKDSKTYYIYSSSNDPEWVWTKKIQVNGRKAAPHIFLDNVNIQVKEDAKTPSIELHGKASAYLYFINRDSKLTGATGRAAIQKNRSEGQLCVQVMKGTTVTCQGGFAGAGIGGSFATRNIADKVFNIDMYGHGVNMHFGSQTNPSLWSGTIIAKGGKYSAGIGGGRGGSGEKLYFYSGKIEATGGPMGAGIGGSFKGRGSDIYIYDGNISATGGEGAPGIGGGCWTESQDMNSVNAARNINIYGGKVYACGSYNGAGIGGGQYVPAHDINITGGEVTAHGAYGAAIGGGRWCHGQNITVTDAKLTLTTGYNQYASDAAAMGYGDLVYSGKLYGRVGKRYIGDFVRDPSMEEDYKSIKVGSTKGKLVKLKVEARAINRDDEFTFFWNLYDILIPNERGLIDVQLLTLPYVKNYGWAINAMELELIDDPCNGKHDFGWVDRRSCHVWACRNMKCQARDPVAPESARNGKHASSGWNTEKHQLLCDVCGHVMETDTKAPVLEVLENGKIYTAEDVRDGKTLEGKPGAYTFTVRDPAASGETSSGIKSVTINGKEQTVGATYSLPAPDGGNNDAGAEYTVVATDNAGNITTATVTVYRRHRVQVISPDRSKTYVDKLLAHNEYLILTLKLPKDAAVKLTDTDDNSTIPYENGEFRVGLIDRNRTFVLEYSTEYPQVELELGRNQRFTGYSADTDETYYLKDASKRNGSYSVGVRIDTTNATKPGCYFSSPNRYTQEQLAELDEQGKIPWTEYKYPDPSDDPDVIIIYMPEAHIDAAEYEKNGSWYVYAKAENVKGTTYVSTPNLTADVEAPKAIDLSTGEELKSYGEYYGDLRFEVKEATPFTVWYRKTPDSTDYTVLLPDEDGYYTIPAIYEGSKVHSIYIEDTCGNKSYYSWLHVTWNYLIDVGEEGRYWDEPTVKPLRISKTQNLEEELSKVKIGVKSAHSDGKWMLVDVDWEIPETYDPNSPREQTFTVNGTVILEGTKDNEKNLSELDVVPCPGEEWKKNISVQVTVEGDPQYTVTVQNCENGTVTVVNATETAEDGTPLFFKDELVVLSIAPGEGYMLSALSVNGIPATVAVGEDTYTFAQPEENVTITATFEKRNEHTIAFDANGGFEPAYLPEEVTTAMPAKKVLHSSEYYLPECEFVAPEGKQFKAWEIDGTEYPVNAPVTVTADITVKALWEDASPAPVEYTVTVTTVGNGTASASPAKAAAGVEITLTAEANTGYHFKEWQVESPAGLVITNNKFTMPDSNVAIKAIFEEDAPPAPTDPAKPSISVTGSYTYDGSEKTANVTGYDAAAMDITGNTGTDAGDYIVSVTSKTGKWADSSTDAVTATWSIGKATQEAPNGLNSLAPTEEGGDGKITGVDARMEYRMEGEYSYAACSGTEIEHLSAGHYFVRYAEDNNHFASPDAAVTVGEGAPLADCTITFNGNDGSGSMGPVTVQAGSNYILPACGFTAPADQEFKAWEIGGTEYKVGDSYTVLGNTEIKALWENGVITPTTCTVTVSNDGNGTGTATPATAEAGTTITLTATPDKGYHFKEWRVVSPAGLVITNNKFTMPDGNVEVKAIFEKDAPPTPTEFTVTFDGNGGTPSVDSMPTIDQKLSSLPSASQRGSYRFLGWYLADGAEITTDTVFSANTTVYAHWTYTGGSGSVSTSYTITIRDSRDGNVTANRRSAPAGATVTITITPDSGYVLETTSVTDKNGNDLKLTDKGNGKYTFTMPGSKVEVKVTFMEDNSVLNFFYDVPNDAYYYEAVKWAQEKGITGGIGNSLFAPNQPCTRSQIVTFLWRVAGSPVVNYLMPFTDVDEGAYYAEAVRWAASEKIVEGTTAATFAPNATVTRAQVVTMLCRFAKAQGMDTTQGGMAIREFDDFDSVPAYALEAMDWAVNTGVFKGDNNRLLPQNACTRAQIVTFLWRVFSK